MTGRRKKAEIPIEASAVPEYVQQAPLLKRRKVTKRKLPSYTEAMMLLHVPEVLRLFWKATLEGLARGDRDIVKMVAEGIGYVKGGGMTLNQQILQNNVVAGAESPVIGFDALARQLAEARSGHLIVSPEVQVIDSAPVQADTAVEA